MSQSEVMLRPITEADLPDYVRWLNDPEVTRYLGRFKPLGRLAERQWFEHAAAAKDSILWAVTDEAGRHIGGTGLHQIHWVSRSATIGLLIGDKEVWGRGYGKDVLRTATRWAFEELGLHRIESECFAENVASARCHEAAGYLRMGTARKRYWRGGTWHDSLLFEILDEDWFGKKAGGPA